jgi:hypothetical protein
LKEDSLACFFVNFGKASINFGKAKIDGLLNGYSFAHGLPRLDENAFYQDLCAGKSIAGGRGTGAAA